MLKAYYQKIARLAGIDRAVAFTLLSRGWSAFSGIITLLLLTRFLTGVQQGFYYTFADILGLQVFFELGLSTVLIQYASHERARLEWTPEGTLKGDETAHNRLAALLRFSLIWYGAVSLLVILVVLPAGLIFFQRHAPADTHLAWRLPWLWIVLVTAANLSIIPLLAVLEGCGLIAEIMVMQVGQNIASSFLFWAALVSHWGLYTAPLGSTVMALWSAVWIWRRRRALLQNLLARSLSRSAAQSGLDWKRDVWPFQWKIGVSWLCGYFIFKLFNPILFAYYGPVVAGQMGLSLSVIGNVAVLALAWMTTKSAPFGMLIARGEFARLDRAFFPCLWQSLVVVAGGSALVWCADVLVHSAHWKIAARFISPLPLALLGGAAICNHVLAAEATYLRAHKKEPFLPLSIMTGVFTALSSLLLGRLFGATGMMAGYFSISALTLIGGTVIFIRKRDEWHRPNGALLDMPGVSADNGA